MSGIMHRVSMQRVERGGRTSRLRTLVLLTQIPAVIGITLSLLALVGVVLMLSLSVQPRLSHLRDAASAARDAHDAMLDEETGVRGFLATGERQFLQPYELGKGRRTAADARLVTRLGEEPEVLVKAIAVVNAQQAWQDGWATPSVDGAWRHRRGPQAAAADLAAHLRSGKALFDAYRRSDATLQDSIAEEVHAAEGTYQRALMASAVLLAFIAVASLFALVRGVLRLQREVVTPIVGLTGVVDRVAAGDLEPEPIVPGRVKEICDLAGGIDTMTEVLGDRIRVAAEREEELVRRGHRLERVLELSRGLAESLSVRYTTMRLLTAVSDLSGAEQADLWLRSRDGQELVRYDVTGHGGRVAIDPDTELAGAVEVGIGAVGRAARYGRAIPLDERRDSRTADAHAAGTAIPLVVGSQVIGVLALRPPAGGALDLHMIDGLILQGASALQAAQLHGDVEEQSRKDALTGLANRRQFDEDLAASVEQARRYGHEVSLVMIDLDHFKQINDLYGHPRGDEVLQDVAAILAHCVRSVDTAYRYGGEELCVLLPDTGAAQALELAERVRRQVETSFPWATASPVTLSAGVAALEEGGDGPRLVGAADRALYAAKRNGRNRVECDGAPARG
jgi:diguanylate cyclase (GGDEF)-like protein